MKTYTIDFVKKTIANLGIKPLFEEYINANKKLKVECPIHGIFYKTFAKFLLSKKINSNGCGKCSIENQRKGLDYAIRLTQELGYVPLFDKYENCEQKLLIECPKHGEFETDIRRLEAEKSGGVSHICVKCRQEHKFKTAIKSTLQLGLIPHFTSYKNNKEKLLVECPRHGKFYITYSNIQILIKKNGNGNGCRKCDNERKSTLTPIEKQAKRKYPEYYQWRNAVYKKNNYTCQKCGIKGGELNAHHIRNYSTNLALRIEVSNGITLCKSCHNEFHKLYGYKANNIEQLIEFLRQ